MIRERPVSRKKFTVVDGDVFLKGGQRTNVLGCVRDSRKFILHLVLPFERHST